MNTHARYLSRLSLAVGSAVALNSFPSGCADSATAPLALTDADEADVDPSGGDDAGSSELPDVDGVDATALPDASLQDTDGADSASGDVDAADDGTVDDVAATDSVGTDSVGTDSDDVESDMQGSTDGVDASDSGDGAPDTLEDAVSDASDGDLDDAGEPEDVDTPVDVGPLYDAPLGIWSVAASLLDGRERAAFGAHGGALWVAGGSDSLGAAKQDFYVYSVSGGVWGVGKPLPTARHSALAAVASGRLYVAGGRETLGTTLQLVERYNPGDQTWVSPPLPQLPTAACCGASAGVGKALWTVGGDSGAPLVRSFEPADGVWSTEAPMAHGRSYPAVAHLPGLDGFGGELVVFGGASTSTPVSGDPLVTIVERYSLETGVWTEAGDAPFARYGLAAATWGGRIWIFGGTDESGLVRDTAWVWDPVLGFAAGQTIPRPRSFHGALATVEGIWLVGGRYATPSSAGANAALELQVDRLTF